MSEKDKASPEQRVTMEQRWADAREACDAGTCDPAEKKFHRAGCMRKIRVEALHKLAEEMDVPPEVRDMVAENWGETPVMTEPSGIKYGGWSAPSACRLAGKCLPEVDHGADCPGSGLDYHNDFNPPGWSNELPEIPAVTVPRGGIRWPVTRLEWVVKVRRRGLFGRAYSVGWRVLGTTGGTNWIDGFRTAQDADNAARQLNRINLEINRRRDQIDDAAR